MGKGGNANPRELKGGKAEQLTVYLYGKAVDVSKFAKLHPGGAKALRIFNNRDATEQFEMYHSPAGSLDAGETAASTGDAESEVATSVVGTDFAKLTQTLHDAFKLGLTLLPGFLGFYLLRSGMPALGSFLIAFSYYMWTSHDYLHHGCLKGGQKQLVHWNNAVGYAIGAWQPYARAFFKKHGFVYRESNLVECVKYNIAALDIRTRNGEWAEMPH
ncbi:hypothetical protein EMIHUDRAFT_216445 [Emiliania huxleyi CCMP1516]|uniref:Cytochrome b5 heme-binding domain-containing protein n=2 Tax=Emiliania huxleyi TaxID=2903 RepID=A0A0D3IEZ2_EMIH1|nr:hypothetical protein EMIHUDRAFT_216445 [Emiliania huxleyi CCMP1516]EOD09827.1 hypothetical protein EMIHUDRAFT_216445 [Emiliania huxleyi CCMP1516]|eukprot:XP_005762256.1 hypothetical protein EMIHUDRAFT_216445 [Emiliania huxleyi CCMP1516]